MREAQPTNQGYPKRTWRLLDTGWQDGATNMAIDEAILESVVASTSPPTLRFYGWQPACLSLGYAQRWTVADVEACARNGWDVVRRPTGGRAILHVDELTYSVCAPVSEPQVHGSVLESYQRLSAALAVGLEQMGLAPSQAERHRRNGQRQGAACFDAPSNYEITVGQRKLVGSAQARKKGVVLQHGTLPLFGDITRITEALAVDRPRRRAAMGRQLLEHATTVETSLGRRVAYEEAVHYLCQGFAIALNLQLQEGTLSEAEWERAQEIRAEKYANDTWTRRL